MKKCLLSINFVLVFCQLFSQAVGIGTSVPHSSAILELSSNNRGFLLPSMASSDRTGIISPADGLMLYDYNTKSIWMRTTSGWSEMITESNNLWLKNGGDIYRSTGNVGIGITNAVNRLQVHNSLGNTNYLRITNDGSGNLASDGLILGGVGNNASLLNHENGLLVLGTNNDSVVYISASVSPRIGIGEPSPIAPLDVRNASGSNIARFNGGNQTFASIFENGVYRGYWGSYSGNPEDVDFGTGFLTNGSLHLTIGTVPKLTISPIGNAGIGVVNPISNAKLHVAGDSLRTAYFTSTHNDLSTSVILKTEALTGINDLFATGIEVDQNITPGRGRGLVVNAGYIGAEIYSADASFATQNYGVIANATSDANCWGLYGTASGSGVTSTKIGVFGSASGGGTNWAFFGIGNAFLSGGTWQTSDERFKKEILPLQNASSRLLKLLPSQYRFDTNQFSYLNLPEETQLGFLAGNMKEVFPELVKKVTVYKDRPSPDKTNESLEFNAVNYTALIPVLTQAINEHTEEIGKMKAMLEEYKSLIREQQKMIEQLKKQK